VVAPQQVHALGVGHLHRQQQRDHLDAELAAVHVVPQEQVVLLRHLSEPLEDVHQVEVLPVDVAHDRQRGLQTQHIRLALCVTPEVRSTAEASEMIFRIWAMGRLPFSRNSSAISLILYRYCTVLFLALGFLILLSHSRFSITISDFILNPI
jgi:hypothetical protein